MEKRVFSLASTEEKRLSIGFMVLFGLNSGVVLLTDGYMRLRPGLHWLNTFTFVAVFVAYTMRYWSNRTRRLEVTDQGLVMMSWMRKPVSIDWSMVCSVKRGYEVLSFSGGKRFDSAVVRAVDGHRIAVPGTSAHSHEIIDILKQRLPENVFEAR